MNILLPLLAFAFCFLSSSTAESTTTTTQKPTQKKTRTVEKDTAYAPKQRVNSPTNFGFVPVKTSENYIQKEPLGRYIFPDLLGQTQAFASKFPSYEKSQISYQPQVAQYAHQQVGRINNYPQIQAGQQNVYPQQYTTIQQQVQPAQDYSQNYEYQYISQPQTTQYYQEPVAKNVNYIPENTVPQYVYLQQSSNAIENVISPKDQGVRYFMFIPNYVPQQTLQNYYVSQPTAQDQTLQNYYVAQPTAQDYTSATISQQPEQVQYVYNTESNISSQKSTSQKEPTSLLDSYVPSVLQLQYYKKLQAQSQANQIVDTEKTTSQSAKKKTTTKYQR